MKIRIRPRLQDLDIFGTRRAGPIAGGFAVDHLGYHGELALSGLGRLLAGISFVLLLKPFASRPRATTTPIQEKKT